MICFLCKTEYDPSVRVPVVDIFDEDRGEMSNVSTIRSKDKTLKLCSDCVRAAVFGIAMNGGLSPWNEDEIEYEEDDVPTAEAAFDAAPEPFTPLIDMDVPLEETDGPEASE